MFWTAILKTKFYLENRFSIVFTPSKFWVNVASKGPIRDFLWSSTYHLNYRWTLNLPQSQLSSIPILSPKFEYNLFSILNGYVETVIMHIISCLRLPRTFAHNTFLMCFSLVSSWKSSLLVSISLWINGTSTYFELAFPFLDNKSLAQHHPCLPFDLPNLHT